jgi:hypothetical protein
MSTVPLVTAIRVVAAVVSGALAVTLFMDGPIISVLLNAIPYWGDSLIRMALFLLVGGLGVLASLRERRRFLSLFVSFTLLLALPTIYPLSSIDWVGLLSGSSKVGDPPNTIITSLELVPMALCLLVVFYLGWLRRFLLEGRGQGLDTGDLNTLTMLSLRFLAVFLAVAAGCSLVAALLTENMADPLLDLTSRLHLAVPILGLGASLVLAAALFLGLHQRSPER